MSDYCQRRNLYVRILRSLVARERRWNEESDDEDLGTNIAALEFAVSRLDGLPEHWQATESESDG